MTRASILCSAASSFALLTLCAALPLGAQQAEAEPSTEVRAAMQLMSEGKFAQAADSCRRLKDLEKTDRASCDLVLAVSLNRTGDHEAAETFARLVIKSAPSPRITSIAHRELGMSLAGQLKRTAKKWPAVKPGRKSLKKLKAAELALQEALDFSPDDATTQVALADVLSARMIYKQEWKLEREIHELLFAYLKANPEGRDVGWARAITCTSNRYTPLQNASVFSSEPEDDENAPNVYVVGPGITKPEKVSAPPPQYSHLARIARLQGVVALKAVIGTQGKVTKLKPVVGLPLCLTEEAMLSILQWQFTPATKDGEPVDAHYSLVVNFRLE